MSLLLIGKAAEIVGSALIFWVAARACLIEVMVIGPVGVSPAPASGHPTQQKSDLDDVSERLDPVNERRRRQFGYWESILVAVGTLLILGGCIIYFFGLLSEQ